MNTENVKIVPTRLFIGNFDFDVPAGLSELLQSAWSPHLKEQIHLSGYHRQVLKKNSGLVTILRSKEAK